jgi:hypothetical protein
MSQVAQFEPERPSWAFDLKRNADGKLSGFGPPQPPLPNRAHFLGSPRRPRAAHVGDLRDDFNHEAVALSPAL